jgi:hypothetical protein
MKNAAKEWRSSLMTNPTLPGYIIHRAPSFDLRLRSDDLRFRLLAPAYLVLS